MKRSAANEDKEKRLQKARVEEPPAVQGEFKEGYRSPGASSSEDKKPEAVAKGTPPSRKCKNFAERVMLVLQDGAGADTIWWIGDGKGIAVHTRNLKRGNMLKEHLKVKDYSVFIRNCNRWGFRRTVQFPVPPGVIAYQCSLFQRDDPHLVHHMRMDSDVQDVFVKHRDSEGNAPFHPKKMAKAARAAAAAGMKPERTAVVGLPNPSAQEAGTLGVSAQQGFTKEQVVQLIQGTNLAGMIQTVTARDPPAEATRVPAASAPNGALSETALLQQLIATSLAPKPPPPKQQEARHDQLLQRILGLSEEYLNHPQQAHGDTESIRMALHILKGQGDKYKAEKNAQQQAQSDPLEALRVKLMAYTNNTPTVTAPTSASMVDRVLQAEQVYQSVNFALFPTTDVAPVPVAAASQDRNAQQAQQQDGLGSSGALRQLLAATSPGQQQQQLPQQRSEVAAPTAATWLLNLLQTPHGNSV